MKVKQNNGKKKKSNGSRKKCMEVWKLRDIFSICYRIETGQSHTRLTKQNSCKKKVKQNKEQEWKEIRRKKNVWKFENL